MSVHRYAARRDANESEIIEALRAVGATVVQVSESGYPDLLVGFAGVNYLIEVKAKKGKLTDDQWTFFKIWGEQCDVARTSEEALKIIGALTDD